MRSLSSFIVLAMFGCGSEVCDLEAAAASHAGQGAVDCGRVPPGADREAPQRCAIDAFERGAAFRVVLEEQGTDSQVARAIAGTNDGVIYSLSWDSDVSGGSDGGEAIWRYRCGSAEVVQVDQAQMSGSGILETAERVLRCNAQGDASGERICG